MNGLVQKLGPSAVLAAGIIGSALVNAALVHSAWLVVAGPVLLGISVLLADAFHLRMRGGSFRPSMATLLMAVAVVVGGVGAMLWNAQVAPRLFPIIAMAAWVALLLDARNCDSTRGIT